MLNINEIRVWSVLIWLVFLIVMQYYTVCSMYLKLQSFTYELSSEHNRLRIAHEDLLDNLEGVFSKWRKN